MHNGLSFTYRASQYQIVSAQVNMMITIIIYQEVAVQILTRFSKSSVGGGGSYFMMFCMINTFEINNLAV